MAEAREKDINQVLRYLTNAFDQATYREPRAVRTKEGPNKLYRLQTEFAYLLHEITAGPSCMQQRNITSCNNYIDSMNKPSAYSR